jgi:hypothetical protein
LKRAIERELLVPLGEGLNSYGNELALTADVRVEKRRLNVSVRPKLTESGRQVSAVVTDQNLYELATRCRALRSDIQRLERSPAAIELRNEIFRLERLEKRLARRQWKRAEETDSLERLPALARITEHLKSASETIYSLEDRILLALYGKNEFVKAPLTHELAAASSDWRDLLLSVCSAKSNTPDFTTMAVFSENFAFLFEMARVYYKLAATAGANVSLVNFRVSQDEKETQGLPLLGRSVSKQQVDKPDAFFAVPVQTVVGIAIGIVSRFAGLQYGPERGLHTFVEKQKSHKCLVDTSDTSLNNYAPPDGIERRASIDHQHKRRIYDYDQFTIEDLSLKTKFYFQGRAIDRAVASACEERMMRDAKSILEAE